MSLLGHKNRILGLAFFISIGAALFGARAASAEAAYHMICRSGGQTVEESIDAGYQGYVVTDVNQTRYTGTSSDIRHRLAPGECSWSTRPIYSGDYGWGPLTNETGPAPFYFDFTTDPNDPNAFSIENALARLQADDYLDIVVNLYVYQRTFGSGHYLVIRNVTQEPF